MKKELILEIIEKVGDQCKFMGKADENTIAFIQSKLELQLPGSYKWFLKEFGHGLVPGSEILGNGLAEVPSCVQATLNWRTCGLPLAYVVIEETGLDWIYCLDTSQIEDDECPVVLWEQEMEPGIERYKSFYDYFFDRLNI